MKRFLLKPRILTTETAIPIAIILLVGLLSVTWFRGNFLIKSGDSFFGLSPNYELTFRSYIWYPAGGVQTQQFTFFPYLLFMAFLENIGISLVTSEKILFYLLFTSSGLSMYYLSAVLTGKDQKRLIGLTSAILYMMNSFTLINIWGGGFTTIVFVYPLLPLSLALFIKGLNTKNFRYLFVISLFWLIFSAALANPAFALPIWMVLISYLGYYIIVEQRNRANIVYALKFCSILLIVWLFLNMFWILPTLPFIGKLYGAAQASGGYTSIFVLTSVSTNILNSLRLLGFWTFYSNFFGDPYFHFASIYLTNPFFVIVSFLIPILAFLPLLFKHKDKYIVYIALLTVCGLFIIKQYNSPFGELNLWIIQNVPYVGMFRDTYEKFGLIVSMGYAFLIGTSVFMIYNYMKKHLTSQHLKTHRGIKKHAPVVFVIIFLLVMQIFMFPFWTGDVIYSGGKIQFSSRLQVPAYYNETAEWINTQPEQFNLLYLPIYTGTFRYILNGTHYGGSDPLDEYFFHKPEIICTWNQESDFGWDAIEPVISVNDPTDSFGKMLTMMNIKYIVVHNDFDPMFTPISPAQLKIDLNRQEGISLVKSFGQIDIYENNFWKPSEIYATSNVVSIQGDVDNLAGYLNNVMDVAERTDFSVDESVMLLSSQNGLSQLSNIPLSIVNYDPLNITCTVYDGDINPANWTSLITDQYAARYYNGWKGVISTNGQGDPDMLIFPSLNSSPYVFPSFSPSGWAAYNSTLLYLVTGENPLTISSILVDGSPASDIAGVWWESDWIGMNTKNITYPIVIPPHQRAIIQINHKADNVTLVEAPPDFRIPQEKTELYIGYQEINPTEYTVSINASQPYFLVFSEPYDKNWVAYVDGQQLSDKFHFIANGNANAWYVNKTGTYTVTLEFWPQKLFYVGSAISITTLISCIIYLSKNKIKRFYQEYFKKNKINN
jgi:hypothetical protein